MSLNEHGNTSAHVYISRLSKIELNLRNKGTLSDRSPSAFFLVIFKQKYQMNVECWNVYLFIFHFFFFLFFSLFSFPRLIRICMTPCGNGGLTTVWMRIILFVHATVDDEVMLEILQSHRQQTMMFFYLLHIHFVFFLLCFVCLCILCSIQYSNLSELAAEKPKWGPIHYIANNNNHKKNGTHDDLQTHMILDKHFRPSTNRTSGRSPHNRCLFWLEWCSQKCWYIYLPCMHGMSRIHNYIRKKHIETFYVHMVCCCCCCFFPSTNHGYWCIANSSNSITELCSCTCFWHSMSELVVTASCQLASQRKWSLKRTSIIMLFINRMAFFLFLLLHYT